MSGRPPPERLGWGEYASPATILLHARRFFLEAIERVAPQVLTELHGYILPLALKYAAEARAAGRVDLVPDRRGRGGHPWDCRELAEARVALDAWAERHHLREEWIAVTVVRTLNTWAVDHTCPEMVGALDEMEPGDGAVGWWLDEPDWPPPPGRASAEFGAWDSRIETEGEARARIRAELEEQLARHLEEETRRRAAEGLVRSPEKWRPEHFDWLALYQVCGKSQAEIAGAAHVTRDAVGNALTQTAAEVGLTLRPPGPPGRPRKQHQ